MKFHPTTTMRLTLVLLLGVAAGCSQERSDVRAAGASADASVQATAHVIDPSRRSLDDPFPTHAGPSPLGEILAASPTCSQAAPRVGMGCLSRAEHEQLREAVRQRRGANAPRLHLRGDVERRPMEATQRAALEELADLSLGALRVDWLGLKGTPGSLRNLHYARPGETPRQVWAAFLAEHFAKLARIWHLESPDDLVLTGQSALGRDTVVLHAERRLRGLPVDGEFVEALVTNEIGRASCRERV